MVNNIKALSIDTDTDTGSGGRERLSLQRPYGIPSPLLSPHRTHHNHGPVTRRPSQPRSSDRQQETHQTRPTDTLLSCLTHLSLCSDPACPTPFPDTPAPRASSKLGTREEQRKVYCGPKLSDRATGGPDAGPLIERFSCLFKDRESLMVLVGGNITAIEGLGD
jgi:1-aminocyclopropane-1-carboxylate synthase